MAQLLRYLRNHSIFRF